jgi:hypothetical protein
MTDPFHRKRNTLQLKKGRLGKVQLESNFSVSSAGTPEAYVDGIEHQSGKFSYFATN